MCLVSFGECDEMVSFDIKLECTLLKEEQARIQHNTR
jgi:hypothetical protein